MAAPCVTGALALLLQKEPAIDWAESRRLILSARQDFFTKPCWNPREEAGLEIERVIGNSVLGTILPSQIPALRRDESVNDIDPSVQLKPHSSGDPKPGKS